MSNKSQVLICPKTKTGLEEVSTNLLKNSSTDEPLSFTKTDDIYDLVYPKELFEKERLEQTSYNNAAQRYDAGVSWVFESLNSNENETREMVTSLLDLKPGMKVLEVGAGTGKDSKLIIDKVTPNGEVWLSDLSPEMLKIAKNKLKSDSVSINYFLANASYLPFPDNSFDALFHFGGINTFSEIEKAFFEMTRVVKPGGKVVVGDESVADWLRNEETYKTLMKANPMFADVIPMQHLPKNAENVTLRWIYGNAFYILDYKVGVNIPTVNVNLPIPGKTDTWQSRADQKQ
jgi:ubiquinone/menaquinone biosynthesis C-methylase UbiE